MRSETTRRFARLTRWLTDCETLSPEERAAADRLLAVLGKMRVVEVVPQCNGSENQDGSPACNGTDVRRVTFQVGRHATERLPVFGANWCADCRALARNMGDQRVILSIGSEPLPPLPTDYPCRNAKNGCARRVTRQNESCTPACGWESISECAEGCR